MMSVCYLFNVFIVTSCLGWIYECIYCTVKTTRWQNRGFLFGPVCPIYGFGFVIVKLVFQYLLPYLRSDSVGAVLHRPQNIREILLIFLVSAVGSAILEYVTSYALEKLFHARWWDYSHVPLNINGRVCLPATCGFGLAGVVIVGYILPAVQGTVDVRFPVPAEELISLLFMFVLASDLVLSVSAVTGLLEKIEALESEFDETVESGYDRIGRMQRAAAERIADVRSEAAGKIADARSGAAEKLADARSGAAEKLADARSGAAEKLADARSGAAEKLADARSTAAGAANKVASNVTGAASKLLTPIQRNTLMNIEKFSSEKHQGIAKRMRSALLRRPGSDQKSGDPER